MCSHCNANTLLGFLELESSHSRVSVHHCHKRQFASSQPRENMADEYRQSLVISNRISTALKIEGLCWTACGQVFSTAAVNTKEEGLAKSREPNVEIQIPFSIDIVIRIP
jgi:hypothetical protein